MNRRDFIKFMGVGSASLASATALANIPEVEPKIILLDKPKDIIIANEMPDVDFIISDGIKSITYYNNEDIIMHENITQSTIPTLGSKTIEVDVEYNIIGEQINLFKYQSEHANTFTFNLKTLAPEYYHLMQLNGRKFMIRNYEIIAEYDSLISVQISAIEVAL